LTQVRRYDKIAIRCRTDQRVGALACPNLTEKFDYW
jgi:hypothetical protein